MNEIEFLHFSKDYPFELNSAYKKFLFRFDSKQTEDRSQQEKGKTYD
jgi:hypothetical protein